MFGVNLEKLYIVPNNAKVKDESYRSGTRL